MATKRVERKTVLKDTEVEYTGTRGLVVEARIIHNTGQLGPKRATLDRVEFKGKRFPKSEYGKVLRALGSMGVRQMDVYFDVEGAAGNNALSAAIAPTKTLIPGVEVEEGTWGQNPPKIALTFKW